MNRLGGAVEHLRSLAEKHPLVTRRSTFAAALLTVCLLAPNSVSAVKVPDPGYENAQTLDSGDVASAGLPQTRGRPSPEIPPIQPNPLPSPGMTVPATPPTEVPLPLSQGPRFVLRDVTITGNTVLDQAAIRAVIDSL
jgi:hypothetical protein